MQACMDGYEVVSPYKDGNNTGSAECIDRELLEKIDLIVTTTGNVNVCDCYMLAAVKRGAIVCNIGHFDLEIDTKFMRDNWRWEEVKPQVHKIYRSDDTEDYIILLSEGRLVNLGNATGHPSRVMDGSFTNQVLAQMLLYKEAWADKSGSEREPVYVKVLPKKLDEEVASEMVKGFGGVITRMTQQQSEYISTPIEGPFKSETYRY
jgi:adenosylhomocysteinase